MGWSTTTLKYLHCIWLVIRHSKSKNKIQNKKIDNIMFHFIFLPDFGIYNIKWVASEWKLLQTMEH